MTSNILHNCLSNTFNVVDSCIVCFCANTLNKGNPWQGDVVLYMKARRDMWWISACMMMVRYLENTHEAAYKNSTWDINWRAYSRKACSKSDHYLYNNHWYDLVDSISSITISLTQTAKWFDVMEHCHVTIHRTITTFIATFLIMGLALGTMTTSM